MRAWWHTKTAGDSGGLTRVRPSRSSSSRARRQPRSTTAQPQRHSRKVHARHRNTAPTRDWANLESAATPHARPWTSPGDIARGPRAAKPATAWRVEHDPSAEVIQRHRQHMAFAASGMSAPVKHVGVSRSRVTGPPAAASNMYAQQHYDAAAAGAYGMLVRTHSSQYVLDAPLDVAHAHTREVARPNDGMSPGMAGLSSLSQRGSFKAPVYHPTPKNLHDMGSSSRAVIERAPSMGSVAAHGVAMPATGRPSTPPVTPQALLHRDSLPALGRKHSSKRVSKRSHASRASPASAIRNAGSGLLEPWAVHHDSHADMSMAGQHSQGGAAPATVDPESDGENEVSALARHVMPCVADNPLPG